jgi:hypothetical protein
VPRALFVGVLLHPFAFAVDIKRLRRPPCFWPFFGRSLTTKSLIPRCASALINAGVGGFLEVRNVCWLILDVLLPLAVAVVALCYLVR